MFQEVMRGSEAALYKYNNVAVKIRVPKTYRLEEIDKKIRIKRTRMERSILAKAEQINVAPKLVKMDEEVRKCVEELSQNVETVIAMEWIEGATLTDYLLKEKAEETYSPTTAAQIHAASMAIAKLHSIHIVHGDCTPNNILITETGVKVIDFGLGGLSHKVEDKAVDLYLFEKAIKAISALDCSSLIEKGYTATTSQTPEQTQQTLTRLEAIRKRGRKRELLAVG
ncbi:TP53 regulating kinase [Nematocida displodere]|uniref:non-specific serine/threonine protein kinase n=1 Tax=Nematocida displodere TaxID=1805483 RepID=A0A177ECD6_9MICR|nr:TP53 regulating kinase [Nematocida displodere]